MDTDVCQGKVRAAFAENRTGAVRPGTTTSRFVRDPRQTPTDLASMVGESFMTIVEDHPVAFIVSQRGYLSEQKQLP